MQARQSFDRITDLISMILTFLTYFDRIDFGLPLLSPNLNNNCYYIAGSTRVLKKSLQMI